MSGLEFSRIQTAAPVARARQPQHRAPVQRSQGPPSHTRPNPNTGRDSSELANMRKSVGKVFYDKNNPNSVLYPVQQARTDIRNTAGSEFKRSLIASILFLIVSNPETYKFMSRLFGDNMTILASTGEITNAGIMTSAVVFFLIYYILTKYVPNVL